MNTATEVLTAADILDGTGATYRNLDYWCTAGAFGDHNQRIGSGRRRAFTPADRQVLVALARTSRVVRSIASVHHGVSQETVRRVAAAVRRTPEARFLLIEPHAVSAWLHRPLLTHGSPGGLVIDLP